MASSHQLAAIMFIDLVGYTSLMGEDEKGAMSVLQQFKNIATPLVAKHNGTWHKDLGDGALCSFGSTHDAVFGAIEIQQQLVKQLNHDVRIGIHLGDVTIQNGDVFGDGVNIASRIQGEAAPGGICISEPVLKTIKNQKGITTSFIANRRLKNVDGKTKLYQVTSHGINSKQRRRTNVISIPTAILIAIILSVASSVVVWLMVRPLEEISPQVERFDINLPEDIPLAFIGSVHFGIGQTALAMSPDGTKMVYAGQTELTTKLFMRSIASGEVTMMQGTDGAFYPFFSPNGKWVAFFSNGYLKKIRVDGNDPITVCQVTNPSGATWVDDDRILFSNNEGTTLLWVQAEGGEIHKLPVKGGKGTFGSYAFPSMMGNNYVLVSSSFPRGILAISIETGEAVKLIDRGIQPRYLASGHLAFVDQARMMVVPFDINKLKTTGEIISIVSNIRVESSSAQAIVSNGGDLIYVPGISSEECQLVRRSLTDSVEDVILDSDYYGTFDLSQDGTQLAFTKISTRDLYLYDLESKTTSTLVRDGVYAQVAWGPGDREVTYSAYDELFIIPTTGVGEKRKILHTGNVLIPYDWLISGNTLLFAEVTDSALTDLKIHNVNDPARDFVIKPSENNEYLASCSPDDKYIAYTSSESGQSEVFVQPYPPDGKRWAISSNGGEEPVWSPTEDKLYYRNKNDWYEVTFKMEPEFSVTSRKKIITGPYLNVPGYSYDIMPDGKHFLFLRPVSEAVTGSHLKVVKNWIQEVKQHSVPQQ